VILAGGNPTFRAFDEVGSTTLTVRFQVEGSAALLVLNPTGVAKVTGLTAPTGF
jgi:hypothetical protein